MMDKNSVSYYVHESITTKLERTIKRLWILCIIMFISFVVSNCLWLHYVSQFDDVVTTTTVTQDVDTGEGDAFVSGTGDVNYGSSETDGNN